MASNLITLDKHPSELIFPATLPLELAMQTGTPEEICASYGISTDEWAKLSATEAFQAALAEAHKTVKEEGGAFKLQARAMSPSLLKVLYDLAHADNTDNPIHPGVKLDAAKSVIRFAGLDASIEQKGAAAGKAVGNALQINIHLP
jgi:hypothetical protein